MNEVILNCEEGALILCALDIAIAQRDGTYDENKTDSEKVKKWRALKGYLMHELGLEGEA